MAIQNLNTQAPRIGKVKGEILKTAVAVEALGITGLNKEMPPHSGDTIIFRRWLPFGGVDNKWITGSNVATFASSHQSAEGVTPTADTLSATDIPAQLNQYVCLYAYSDRTADLYEDGIPDEMKRQTGKRMGLVREMIRYGALKAATNAFFAGGTSISTVTKTIDLNMLRKVARTLHANHAEKVTAVLDGSNKYAMYPIEAAYLVFCHTHMIPAIRELPGFKHVSEYAKGNPMPYEVGACEDFRFIASPELAPILGASGTTSAVGSTGLDDQASSGYVDVYPVIVVGEEAWGDVALRGANSFSVNVVSPNQIDKADPTGARGYISAKFYSAAVILNQGYMATIWAGAPAL